MNHTFFIFNYGSCALIGYFIISPSYYVTSHYFIQIKYQKQRVYTWYDSGTKRSVCTNESSNSLTYSVHTESSSFTAKASGEMTRKIRLLWQKAKSKKHAPVENCKGIKSPAVSFGYNARLSGSSRLSEYRQARKQVHFYGAQIKMDAILVRISATCLSTKGCLIVILEARSVGIWKGLQMLVCVIINQTFYLY